MQKTLSDISIVFIDDDEEVHKQFADVLEKEHGCTVHKARTGREGLLLIKEKKPHAIILELLIPELDGFELIEKIQNDNEIQKIPIIILTDLEHPEGEERGLSMGAHDFLVKAKTTLHNIIDSIHFALKKNA